MPETAPKLSGTERAAILLMTLGEENAAQIVRHLGSKEVQRVGMAMAKLKKAPRDTVNRVLSEFMGRLSGETSLGIGSEDYLRNVLVQALGKEKANGLASQIMTGQPTKGLETLKWMDANAVYGVIRNEHPQIIAIVLSRMEPDQAAGVFALLPNDNRPEVLERIANLDRIPPAAMAELDEILERQLADIPNLQSDRVDGLSVAASILNYLGHEDENEIFDALNERDGTLGEKLYDAMFVFENIVDIDDRGMQALLREVENDSLIIALKGADHTVRQKIFSNMSKRAADLLEEELEVKGPVRLAEVEEAQKAIVTMVRRMADAGDIALGGMGEQYV